MNQEIHPEGLLQVLSKIHKKFPQSEIYITENGIADHRDTKRSQFLKDHLFYAHKAIKAGVPLRNYCHWSLIDNFEWMEGFAPRFGLYEVDYQTMQRTPRPSANLFQSIAKSNTLPSNLKLE